MAARVRCVALMCNVVWYCLCTQISGGWDLALCVWDLSNGRYTCMYVDIHVQGYHNNIVGNFQIVQILMFRKKNIY